VEEEFLLVATQHLAVVHLSVEHSAVSVCPFLLNCEPGEFFPDGGTFVVGEALEGIEVADLDTGTVGTAGDGSGCF